MFDRRSKGFFTYFLRAYPVRTTVMVALLLGAGLSEGVGIATLLPVLELGTADPSAEPSQIALVVEQIFQSVGLQPTLGPLLIVIVVAMTLKGLFRWLAMREVGYVVARVALDLRLRMIRALMRAEWRYFSRTPTGYFANSLGWEAHRAAGAYREACAALAGVFQVLVYGTVVVLASWQVALFAAVVGSGVLFLLRGWVGASRSAGIEQTNVLRSLVARLTEALPGLKPIKAMAREQHVAPLLESETQGFYRAQQRQVLASETLHSFQEPLLVAAVGVGLFTVLTYTSTPFSVVLVMTFLFYRVVGGLNVIQMRYNTMAGGESAFWSMMEHITEAERAQETSAGSEQAPTLREAIRLDDVSFSYGDHPVLEGVDLEIAAGAFVTLVGSSGSGKTTLADLVIGLIRPTRGRVLVDGVDLIDVEAKAWRSRIGYVPQDLLLFHDTILRNVTLGNDGVTRDEVEEALRAAGAWDFVSTRPEGMDWVVGEGGSMLSGGQRQRIAIARALVEKPQLLVLDEPTTALDPRTEAAICSSLVALKGSVTILAISHQAALRNAADVSFRVADGRVERLEAPVQPVRT